MAHLFGRNQRLGQDISRLTRLVVSGSASNSSRYGGRTFLIGFEMRLMASSELSDTSGSGTLEDESEKAQPGNSHHLGAARQ